MFEPTVITKGQVERVPPFLLTGTSAATERRDGNYYWHAGRSSEYCHHADEMNSPRNDGLMAERLMDPRSFTKNPFEEP